MAEEPFPVGKNNKWVHSELSVRTNNILCAHDLPNEIESHLVMRPPNAKTK